MLARMARTLIVKATAGADAPERCAQAFTVAATGGRGRRGGFVVADRRVGLVRPARPGGEFELPHSAPLAGPAGRRAGRRQVTLCTQCAARRDITAADVLPGVRIAGAAAFVEECLADGAQALVY